MKPSQVKARLEWKVTGWGSHAAIVTSKYRCRSLEGCWGASRDDDGVHTATNLDVEADVEVSSTDFTYQALSFSACHFLIPSLTSNKPLDSNARRGPWCQTTRGTNVAVGLFGVVDQLLAESRKESSAGA